MKALMGCCIAFIIVIALVVGLVAGGIWYVFNMTLGELGLDDQVLVNNKTVAELGLSDVKVKDIFSFLTSILEGGDESVLVTHPFTEQDLTNVENILGGSNIIDPVTGNINLDNVDGGYVIFPSANPITFKDTELAALFNLIMQEGLNSSNQEQEQMSETETDPSQRVSIKEIKLTVTGTTGATMRTVIKFDISELGDQINNQVPGAAQGYVQLGNAIYIITESSLSADSEGKILAGSTHTVSINSIPNAISDPFMLLLVNAMLESNEEGFKDINGDIIEPSAGFFAEMMCGLFAQFIYRFGVVGLTSANLGNSGFQAVTAGGGSITIVPWTIDTVPVDDSYLDNVYSTTAEAKASSAFYMAQLAILRKANSDPMLDDIDSVSDLITYLNDAGIQCVSGTAAVDNAVVIDVTYDGATFTLNSVYAKFGSATCEYIAMNNSIITLDEAYEYPVISRANADMMAADSMAKQAVFMSLVMSYYVNQDIYVVADDNVDAFLTMINTQYGVLISAGTEAPATNGVNINITFSGGWYQASFANSYARFGTQIASFVLIEL